MVGHLPVTLVDALYFLWPPHRGASPTLRSTALLELTPSIYKASEAAG